MSSRAGCLHSDERSRPEERSRADERSRAPVNLWIPFAVPPALLLALLALQWLERSLFGQSLDRHIRTGWVRVHAPHRGSRRSMEENE